ncbi:DUF3472 domain-containing protein [Chryseobacterium sp. Tr-659]|uniref:DUF3472 domain-containing protein n=1 Tax=Chryseobacterium sp. Tr-659 TaxID=2608340 RepID=UPI0014244B65|nr:DUF3472 domain-containing protein [Chryseobacterium sp. Tr-659]NIF04479.1 DUF3472 domain-containing protein [Chryseobacterium sp. Tr-659]
MSIKLLANTFIGIALLVFQSCAETTAATEDTTAAQEKISALKNASSFSVPVAGNSFLTVKPSGANEVITSAKLGNWTSSNTIISTYFRVGNSGTLNIGLKASVPSGTSVVKVTVGSTSKNITLTGTASTEYTVGDFTVSTPGYVKVDLQGVSKTGGYFADVTDITFSGAASAGTNIYSNDPSYYYWARRGPSCHLNYTIPTTNNVSYYYNEVTVPAGEDKIGSYFMANGFSAGYFGMQVNSATERRILFSVWSPFETDDPNNIPPDHKIILNRSGSGVTVGEFGNEGSGGQSYYKYNWIAGQTYKFLLKGEPDGTGKTDFTAWFLSPDTTTWKLIASWKRPQTSTYLKSFYSFVENFNPENGYQGRKAEFKNQWVRTSNGSWIAISGAKFSVDNTYNAKQRIDAMGGTSGNAFFLQNGGFFNTTVAPGSQFSITAPTQAPNIDFSTLP